MSRRFQNAVVATLAALLVCSLGAVDASAGGGSGWGWAKPLNKRMGAFYTSNKNANFTRSKRSRSHYRSYRSYATPRSQRVIPGHHSVRKQYVPQQVTPARQPVIIRRHVPTTTIRSSQPTVIPSSQPHRVPSAPVQTTNPAPTSQTLPHRSTATGYWQ